VESIDYTYLADAAVTLQRGHRANAVERHVADPF
jgi:hypothetical protein